MTDFPCISCNKTFNTEKGRDMHFQAKHSFECPDCGKHFRSSHAVNQHYDAVHREYTDDESTQESSEYWPNNPVDEPGQWVYLCDFTGYKSFGYFECASCDKTWISAHAYPDYEQGCAECDYYNFPKLLWKNDKKGKPQKSKLDLTKPHRVDLCGKCQSLGGLPCWQYED